VGAPRILVLEDDVGIRRMLEVLLQDRGYEVTLVGSAEAARAAHAESPFDLLVFDKNLPDGDGVALATELVGHPSRPEAIIVTAYPTIASAVEALHAGAIDYLPKPFDVGLLSVRVERALDRRRRREENERLHKSVVALADHLTQVFEASFDPILTIDADGTIVRWNRGAERTYGYAADFIQGKPMHLLERNPDAEVGRRMRALRGEPTVNEEVIRRTRDGDERSVLVSLAAMARREGEPRRLVEVSKDITAQKAMQNELLHADRLKTLGTLAAGLAHEINNPLAFVKANLTLLAERSADPSVVKPEEAVELVQESLDGVERIVQAVRHLRGFSRAASDRPVEASLGTVIEGTVALARFRIRERRHAIDVEVADMPPIPCMPARLGQAILNLVINALDASGPTGHVWIKATVERGEAVIEIRDNGPGIPAEIQPRVFEPFFTTKSPGEGTGLGLGICRQIAEEHRGRLYLRTCSEAGTSFFLRIPFYDPSRYVVLLVDDEHYVRRALRRLLESLSYQVYEASRVPEGLHILETAKVHAVIADYHMPGATGLDLLVEMHKRWPAIRRLVLTASEGLAGDPDAFAPVQPVVVLAKPWDDAHLTKTLRSALLMAPF